MDHFINMSKFNQAQIEIALKTLLQLIANPAYLDKSANQLRAQVTGAVTVASTTVSAIGSFPGDHLQRMDNMTAWATAVRSKIS